jgi:alpha-D-ribose 1-methylphosphonate 5-triphosphate diphosphatase PhnM
MGYYNENELVIGTRKFQKYEKMFAEAGEQAVQRAKKRRLAVTYIKDNKIIQEHFDGKKDVLAEAPKRVNVIKRARHLGLEIIRKNSNIILIQEHSNVRKRKPDETPRKKSATLQNSFELATHNACVIKLRACKKK